MYIGAIYSLTQNIMTDFIFNPYKDELSIRVKLTRRGFMDKQLL